MKPNKDTIDASARSPFAGCVILIAAVCVMVFLVGFSIVALFRQFNEIAKFTAEEPVGIEVSAMENKEPELNALAERLESFRQQYPDDNLCLVMGSDAFNGLSSWYHWQQIPQLAHIIVIERAGVETATRPDWAAEQVVYDVNSLRNQSCSSILYVSLKGYDISATRIRQRLHAGQDVRGMLAESVIDYIIQNRLYQTKIS